MKTKFTPGPWFARKTGGFKLEQIVCTSDYDCVANMDSGGDGFTIDEVDANTHLIAAAPCLYRELKHLTDLLNLALTIGKLDIPGLATLNGAQAALRKARGEK